MLNAVSQMASQLQTNTEQTSAAFAQIRTEIEELKKDGTKEQLKTLNSSYAGVYQVLQAWDARLNSLQTSVSLSVALCLFLAEQVLGASRADILGAAAGEAPSVNAMIMSMQQQPGKG
jgi:hypothetical protein